MKKILLIFFLLFIIQSFYNTCTASDSNRQIILNFLFKPGCIKCIKIEKQLVKLKARHPSLNIKSYNVNNTDNFNPIIELLEKYSVPDNKGFLVPAIFVGNSYYIQHDINFEKINKCLDKLYTENNHKTELRTDSKSTVDEKNSLYTEYLTKVNSFSYITVLTAGLIDGVNPCSFALLIFFLSYLKIAGRTRTQLIKVGLAYSISVFITYILIGLGFFHGINAVIAKYTVITFVLYLFSGILALAFAFLTIWDIYIIHTDKKNIENRIILKLGSKTKNFTHKLIRSNSRTKFIILGTIAIGIGVSFLELGCTGQIYLPVILFIIQQKFVFSKVLLLFIIYNFAFILPLLFIFTLTILGMTYERLLKWFQSNLIKLKLITAAVFLILGILILNQIFI